MKILTALLGLFCFSVLAGPEPEMEIINSNIYIKFNDYENAVGFENYKCNIDFGTWIYVKSATKNGDKYQCLYQGELSANTNYSVNFTFEDRPYRNLTHTNYYTLNVLDIVGTSTHEYSIDDAITLDANFVFDNVDLRAIVSYPTDINGNPIKIKMPVFIMQHGQYDLCNVMPHTAVSCPDRKENHKGYMKLLNDLAQSGVIAISIDAYDLLAKHPNDPAHGVYIEQRAQLFKEHIEHLKQLNDGQGLLSNTMDFDKLSLGGHSRGATAAYSAVKNYPEYGVSSLVAISPTTLAEGFTGINSDIYVIAGSADNDVVDFWSYQLYSNSDYQVNKGLAYIRGANHNWFNSKWVNDDSTSLRTDMLTHEEQESLGAELAADFIKYSLLGTQRTQIPGNINYSWREPSNLILSEGIDNIQPVTTGSSYIAGSFWDKDYSYNRVKVIDGSVTYPLNMDLSNYQYLSFRAAQLDDIEGLTLTITVEIDNQFYVVQTEALPTGYDLVPAWGLPKNYFMSSFKIDLKAMNPDLSNVQSIKIEAQTTTHLDDIEII